jgi:phosphatidate cytidylyltransferase
MGRMYLSHPSPIMPTASWWKKRIVFLALLVLQVTASNNVNHSPRRSSNDRWIVRKPQTQPLHRVSKSTEALLRQSQPDCLDGSRGDDSRIRIRGGGDDRPSAAFQKRVVASIVLLAGLSLVVMFGQEPGLQFLVWILTPGLYHEATAVVQQIASNPQVAPTTAASTATSSEEVVLAPESNREGGLSAQVVSDAVASTPDTDTAMNPDTATTTPDTTTSKMAKPFFVSDAVSTPDTAIVTPDTTMNKTAKPFINKWWWFVTYTLGLSSQTNHLLRIPDAWLPSIHLASFGMIMGGLVQVVLQLNARGSDIADFIRACEELAIAHLAIFLTLLPATAWMSAVHLFGKEWVLYAAFLVVINDTAAYFFGKNFGKHALLPKISPNKTWEGWMGALVSTLLLSFPLWKALFQNTAANYDRHAFVLALYCAVVAPFGGFLASTVKRAYGKKDFGSLIAGHGGLIDRLDCQLVTAPFVYLYLTAVKVKGSPV